MNINESGAYEREVEQNWAAAYAKRLTDQEANERDQAIAAAVSGERNDRIDADNAIKDGTALEDNCIYSRHIHEGNVTSGKIHDLDVTEAKLAADSVTTEKIKDKNVTEAKLANKSVSSGKIQDYAVTNIKLDSDVFATVQETRWGDDTRKAVTPNGLKQGVGYLIHASVSSGDFGMDNIPCSSIDADVTSIFHNPVRDAGLREYSETPVQVGTWVDGTPVWRVAISKTLSAADFSAGYYTFSAADWGVSSSFSDISLILNYTLALYYPGAGVEDTHFVDLGKSDMGYKLDLSGASSGYILLRGFVEFVTPATNIITE